MSEFDVCPRCEKETKDLHEDDGLCPKCEGEWVDEYTAILDDASPDGKDIMVMYDGN